MYAKYQMNEEKEQRRNRVTSSQRYDEHLTIFIQCDSLPSEQKRRGEKNAFKIYYLLTA